MKMLCRFWINRKAQPLTGQHKKCKEGRKEGRKERVLIKVKVYTLHTSHTLVRVHKRPSLEAFSALASLQLALAVVP